MKSIRTELLNHAAEGDERIRTAVPSLGADFSYVALAEGSLPDVLLAKLLGERAGAKS